MKALVTGGSGFCGERLKQHLETIGVDVFTLAARSRRGAHYAIADAADGAGMAECLAELKPDFIFHLAGITNATSPALVYSVNVGYASELLGALDRTGQRGIPILLVGTTAEYGLVNTADLPLHEDFPARPYDHHGISKLAQTLVGQAAARSGYRTIMVRPSNIIGPGMPDHLLLGRVARAIRRIQAGEQGPQIEIGNLQTFRDFIDVGDVVEIYGELIKNPRAYGQIVNVCTGTATSVRSVVERLVELSGLKIDIVSQSSLVRAHDPAVHFGSTSKLQDLIGRVPPLDLDRTLRSILVGSGPRP